MRSLSSTVREIPSSWLPSRSVVSKTSMDSGSVLSDMFDPVLVPVDLAAHRREVRLLDGAGHRAGLADLAVVDGTDGHDLRRGTSEKGLLAGIEVAAQDVAHDHLVPEITGDRHHRVLSDAFESTGRNGRRDDAPPTDDEDVLARALADEALGRQQDGLVVAGLEGLDLGHRRVDVH